MLNADQTRVFKNVESHLLHQKQHEDKKCQCDDIKPLRMFVSGVGGTGKSFLIEAIKAFVDNLWPSQDLKCAITAPTGLAAFNVGGVTIHRLFQLPIEHDGKEAGYWSLSKAAQKVMKATLRSLKMLIIDEVSMVSSLNLAFVHLRLEELFGGDEWFGGKNVLFVGDLLQLQPVNGNPVFESINKKTLCHRLGCATSINIWKDSVVYDELTINERQKNDGEYSSILDEVRCGNVSEETVTTLQERVMEVTVAEQFTQLRNSPVCLFPTRKQCENVNEHMLSLLESEKHVISCTDEVDETTSTAKWHDKAAKQLEKLNHDCNKTAGLEAVLKLAVGARVMLRYNIDLRAGKVNGAIGTVLAVLPSRISIKFDHLKKPCDIEKVKGKFIVMKNYYVYRTQFPLILAYAVTIHKCQGLSLDCAIEDLSDKVFADGMSYVALSRLKTLIGLHLIAFDPKSIRVSVKCLKEVNRLRGLYRKDLPLYDIPVASAPTKRKLTGSCESDKPAAKKPRTTNARKSNTDTSKDKKKSGKSQTAQSEQQRLWPFKFHTVDETWQRSACETLGLHFISANGVSRGGRDVPLTRPDFKKINSILGDGNCMFRSLSYVTTGTENQHVELRAKVIQHMRDIAPLMLGHIKSYTHLNNCSSVEEYIKKSAMDQCAWGSDLELLAFAHLSKTCVFSYCMQTCNWHRYGPHNVDKNIAIDTAAQSIYLRHPCQHYDVVLSTQEVCTSSENNHKQNNSKNSKRKNSDTLAPPKSEPSPPKKQQLKRKKLESTPEGIPRSTTMHGQPAYTFHTVDEQWQRNTCAVLGLDFVRSNRVSSGGSNINLTRPKNIKRIQGDGNCLFRSFSYLITGSEMQFKAVRRAIVNHMPLISAALLGVLINEHSVQQYIRATGMDRNATWGTDIEMFTLTHMLRTCVFVYKPDTQQWQKMSPDFLGNVATDDIGQKSMYIVNENDNHFEVVLSV